MSTSPPPAIAPLGPNESLRAVLTTVLGIAPGCVRPANRNAPTGMLTDAFATVLITTLEPTGQDDITLEPDSFGDGGYGGEGYGDGPGDSTVTETTEGQRHIVASVQFFRANALSYAQRLPALLRGYEGRTTLAQYNLGFIRAGSVTDLTKVVDSYFEERSQIELEFYFITQEQSPDIPTFGSFSVTIETQDETVNEVISQP